jgi:O-antigen/teichoic acid export membrane protein
VSSIESQRFLRHLAAAQATALIGLAAALAALAPQALRDGVAGVAVMAVAVLASGAYALGGGVLGAESAALRAVVATVGRWLLAGAGLLLLASRDGAVVWAVAAGALVAQAAYIAATITFKRV